MSARAPETQGLSLRPAVPLEPVLIAVVGGPARGASLRLERGTALIGSSGECELVLADPAVSRRHATVELLPGAVCVRDAGSRNGVFYLGARIAEARVPIGGRVRIGRSELQLRAAAPATPESERDELAGLVGRSTAMRRLFAQLERLGPSDASVLICGETGTGKEAVARALHQLSPRSAEPFAVFDCASVNPNLFESELFGHVAGAFTDARQSRAGVVEEAQGGTVLLDEIGELPLDLQPKLLRLLESREYRRVGDSRVRQTSARFLAATHRDLERQVREERFRADLFFRIAPVQLHVAALRERPEDIAPLAQVFARQLSGGTEVTLGAQVVAALQCYPWPGNVRELRNAVARALALGTLEPAAEGGEADAAPFFKARDQVLELFERDYLSALLARSRGNVCAAARLAGLSRSQFYRMLERHQLLKGLRT